FGVFIWTSLSAIAVTGPQILPFVLLIAGLFYCVVAHQLFRYGASRRQTAATTAAPAVDLTRAKAPTVTVLIPSYMEDRRVIVATTLSAALMRYRNKRIVVLVDDPQQDSVSLQASFAAVAEVNAILEHPKAICSAAL